MFQHVNLIDIHCPYCKEEVSREEVDGVVEMAQSDEASTSLVIPCECCGELIELYLEVPTDAQFRIFKV